MTPSGRQGYILINKSKVLEEMQDYDGALESLRLAISRMNAEGEHRLRFAAHFRLVGTLCKLGRYAEAEPLFGT